MENRDRDKLNKNSGSNKGSDMNRKPSDIGNNKNNSSADFGKKDNQSDLNNEPGGRVGKQDSSGMKGSGSNTAGKSGISSSGSSSTRELRKNEE